MFTWNKPAMFATVGITAAVLAVGAAACTEESSSPPPAPAGRSASVENAHAGPEKDDLLYLKLDDRSSSGITDLWLVWKIKNTSNKKSNYIFDWEAVDTHTGTRVSAGTEYEQNVLAGQTATGDTFTTLKTKSHIKIRVTSFDRSSSW